MAWWRKHRGAGVAPDMNVTPLVDVVLVLLIIFMVVMPQMDKDVPVNLPGIFNPDPEVEGQMDPIKVSVATWGKFHYLDQEYDLDGLLAVLTTERAADPSRRLVLRGDAKLKYGDVRQLMAKVQTLGFPGVNFMVGEKHKGTGPGDRPSTDLPPGEGESPTASAPATGAEG